MTDWAVDFLWHGNRYLKIEKKALSNVAIKDESEVIRVQIEMQEKIIRRRPFGIEAEKPGVGPREKVN